MNIMINRPRKLVLLAVIAARLMPSRRRFIIMS
jgi:hypothetical protein